MGMFSTGFATGVTLGAPLGGLLLTFLNWRALFFVNPLLGVILLATGSRVLGKFPRPRTWEWRTLDPYGGMIITATLAMFILTLTWARDHGVTDVRNLIGLVAVAGGVALLTADSNGASQTPCSTGTCGRTAPSSWGSSGSSWPSPASWGPFFCCRFFWCRCFIIRRPWW